MDIDAKHQLFSAPYAENLNKLDVERSLTGKKKVKAIPAKFGKPGRETLIDVGAKAFNDIIRFAHKNKNRTIIYEP